MENKKTIADALSYLDNVLDSLNYELRHNFSDYSEDDFELLKNGIVELSVGFRSLFNIINHE